MSAILDAGMEHFAALPNGRMVVPEWKNAIITWKPITVADHAYVSDPARDGPFSKPISRGLVRCALDEKGEPAFKTEDEKFILNKLQRKVVARVFNTIFAELIEELPELEAEKND